LDGNKLAQFIKEIIDKEEKQCRGDGRALGDTHLHCDRELQHVGDQSGTASTEETPSPSHQVEGKALIHHLPKKGYMVHCIVCTLDV